MTLSIKRFADGGGDGLVGGEAEPAFFGGFPVADPDGKFAGPVRLDVSPKEMGRKPVGTCGPFCCPASTLFANFFMRGERRS